MVGTCRSIEIRRGSRAAWFYVGPAWSCSSGCYSLTVAADHGATTAATTPQGVEHLPARVGVQHAASGSGDGVGAARPLVRAGRRPPRRGLPPLLVHQGHRRRRSRSSSTRSGSQPGHARPRRRLRARPPRPRAGRAAASRSSASTSASASSTSPPRPHRRARRSCAPTPARSPFDAEFDAAISLCQGAFGLTGGPGRTARRRRRRARRDGPGPAPGGRLARVGVLRLLPGALPRGAATPSTPTPGVNHERTEVRDEAGWRREVDLWTTCFTPRELRLLATAAGLERRAPLVGDARRLRARRAHHRPPRVPARRPPAVTWDRAPGVRLSGASRRLPRRVPAVHSLSPTP